MKVIEGIKYSKDHEWVKIEGTKAYIGITDHAQDELGDIVFVDLPEEGAEVAAGDVLGAVESVKAASDIYSPVSGKVVEVNGELNGAPELINEDPYGAWIAVVEMEDPEELNQLMDAQEYRKFCQEEA